MTRNYLYSVLALCVGMLCTIYLDAQYQPTDCIPDIAQSHEARIRLIKIDGKKYVTHGSDGYHRWTSATVPLQAGTSYPLVLKPVYFSKETTVYWKIWVDYNQDGDFTDLYEYACVGQGIGAIGGQINIPTGVWNGKVIMRVAISVDGFPKGPCDPISSGEVEDFQVVISDGLDSPPTNIQKGGLCVYMPNKIGSLNENDVSDTVEYQAPLANTKPVVNAEIQQSIRMEVYPNPAVAQTTIKTYLNDETAAINEIRVVDIQGKLMHQVKYTHADNGIYRLDTRTLRPGMYHIISSYGDIVESQKLIVVR